MNLPLDSLYDLGHIKFMSDKRFQFQVAGPSGCVCFETDNPEILRRVGEVLKDPSVSQFVEPPPKAGRPGKPVYVIEASDLFSEVKAGTKFPTALAASAALGVSPLTVRQALYIARKSELNFAKVRGVTVSYEQTTKKPEPKFGEEDEEAGKPIMVISVDADSPASQLTAFDQFPSALITSQVLGVAPQTVAQALYVARKAGHKQAKVKGVTLAYLEDYANENVRD